MKKIVVFICLMFISSSVYSLSLTIDSYKEMKETARENGNMKVFLRGQIEGIYQGLLGMVIIIESNAKKHGTKTNVALWCSPDNLSLNYQNLICILILQMPFYTLAIDQHNCQSQTKQFLKLP